MLQYLLQLEMFSKVDEYRPVFLTVLFCIDYLLDVSLDGIGDDVIISFFWVGGPDATW